MDHPGRKVDTLSNSRPFCVAQCARRGYHAHNCPGDCAGCYPRLAADGVLLCTWHLGKLGEDPPELARLHDELALRLANSGQSGEKTSGTREPGLALNEAAMGIRSEIENTLHGWARIIAEERGWTPPRDDVESLAEFVARDPKWLAAHRAADEVSNQLRDLVGRAHSIAYPSGIRRFQLPVQCPGKDEPCGADLWTTIRPADLSEYSDWICAGDPQHIFNSSQWLTIARRMRKEAA